MLVLVEQAFVMGGGGGACTGFEPLRKSAMLPIYHTAKIVR